MLYMKNVNLTLPEEMLDTIDRWRDDVPRNAWIRRAIEERLHRDEQIRIATVLGQSAERVAAREAAKGA